MAVNLDVIVGRDPATLPARKDVWLVRQFSQLKLVDLGEEFGAAGAEAAHLAGVEFDDKHANGGIQFRQGKEPLIAQPRQDPALCDLNGDFNLRRAAVIGITWPMPEGLDDGELERRLFTPPTFEEKPSQPLPDWSYVHKELKRRGVTLLLLWEEYRAEHTDGYRDKGHCVPKMPQPPDNRRIADRPDPLLPQSRRIISESRKVGDLP